MCDEGGGPWGWRLTGVVCESVGCVMRRVGRGGGD